MKKRGSSTEIQIPHSFDVMKKILTFPISSFDKFGQVFHTQDGRMIYKDNGSDILAVAHLDSVAQQCFARFNHKENRVYSPWLDDRLGAYIILYLLPKLGIKADILLTEGEETGHSTAVYFNKDDFKVHDKKYKWMVEFDRMGEDVVMYEYECDDLVGKLEKHGFKVGMGTFTDIGYLNHLECLGFNVSVGYQSYHSANAYADLDVLDRQLNKFVKFYKEFKDEEMPYDKTLCKRRTYYNSGSNFGYNRYMDNRSEWYNDDYDFGARGYASARRTEKCKWCLADKIRNATVKDDFFCQGCGTCIEPGTQRYGQKCGKSSDFSDAEEYDYELQEYILNMDIEVLQEDFPEEWKEYSEYKGFKVATTFRQWLLMGLLGLKQDSCPRCNLNYVPDGKRICEECDIELGKDFRVQFFHQMHKAKMQNKPWREWAADRDANMAMQFGAPYEELTEGMSLQEKAMVGYKVLKEYIQKTQE